MNTIFSRFSWCGVLLPLGLLVGLGCEGVSTPPRREVKEKEKKPPEAKIVPVDKSGNVSLEIQGEQRRVRIKGTVCRREGQLEQFLTRRGFKEHEAIVAAKVDARDIHKALLAAGAAPGSPVQFVPQYKPAHGTVIKVSVEYKEKGKTKSVTAQDWIWNMATKKNLAEDWVFAGSRFVPDPEKKRPDIYLANDGDVICVSNFESALLDLPIKSPKEDAGRAFAANTKRIPPVGTEVVVILAPVAGKAEDEKADKK